MNSDPEEKRHSWRDAQKIREGSLSWNGVCALFRLITYGLHFSSPSFSLPLNFFRRCRFFFSLNRGFESRSRFFCPDLNSNSWGEKNERIESEMKRGGRWRFFEDVYARNAYNHKSRATFWDSANEIEFNSPILLSFCIARIAWIEMK